MLPFINENCNGLEIIPQTQEEIKLGDIVAYENKSGDLIIHQVVDIKEDNEGTYYTMKGFEDVLCIEKKSNIKEVLINICRGDRVRFKKFLERMSKFKYKYFIIEDSPDRVAKVLRSIPDCRMSPRTFYFWIANIVVDYGIPVIFTGHQPDVSKAMVNEIFTKILEKDLK